MRQQLTTDAIVLLVGVVLVFWLGIAAVVRQHGARRAAHRAHRMTGEPRG